MSNYQRVPSYIKQKQSVCIKSISKLTAPWNKPVTAGTTNMKRFFELLTIEIRLQLLNF